MTHELEAECRACNGEGVVDRLHLRPQLIECEECGGTGWIKCGSGLDCPFPAHCYCEAAFERQQADNASEPPMTADDRHQQAWRERQALRGGYPL